ncbi:MAG: DNA topoisomerase IB, partial [Gammaproteobacteria bacterium]
MIRSDGKQTLTKSPQLDLDPKGSARAAGLRYVSDAMPGIRRKKAAKGFRYVDATGAIIRDLAVLGRIKALAIPPAWRKVWICSFEQGHLQAVGQDQRNRKQYRYHPRWREVRDEVKYGQTIAFGRALPALRKQVGHDLALPGLPRQKVLAILVCLLEITLIRVGNQKYARENSSFGLTTLRARHLDIAGSNMRFRFRGKSGIDHTITVTDRRIARILRRIVDLPGEELFQYLDEKGERRTIESTDVNEYVRAAAGADFSAKDFRTWAGTVLALRSLQDLG